MSGAKVKIAVVAPGKRLEEDVAARVGALVEERYSRDGVELVFHPQCFLSHGHFAGSDQERLDAFLEVANAPDVDCVWFAIGGYGACRLVDVFSNRLTKAARAKTYIGYSDAGFLLAGLYARGIGQPIHGPMPTDMRRDGGETAIARVIEFLLGKAGGLEPSVAAEEKALAFNITVLSNLLGTPFEADLSGHVLMLEDVGEYHYQLDRSLFHITSDPAVRRVAGIRLGRCSNIPTNDRPFGQSVEEIIAHWCEVSGIPFLGRADIGHDAGNKIVPFGNCQPKSEG